ncbi:DUF7683 domain-containing protein [Dyadobacter pollutisoli]|uniref:DUF7683 domain-containing protein n=1 Tax=Dyadobacter pollutisoli TaxID=2910158 RepID=A0A9E8NBU7_9BACT|nr:hypothetical protein [Dyadobacter pollutisoli]WAC13780.1 hypothetical protein ON006_07425 [Dyadobacter pollutisoli]
MEIKRVIFVYNKANEDLIDEILIDIPIESLKSIFTPYEDDPDLIMSYDITEEQASQLQLFKSVDFNLLNNIYQMECYQE